MTKRFIFTLLFTMVSWAAFGQTPIAVIDSIKLALAQSKQNTSRVLLMTEMAANYQFFKPDTAIKLVRNAVALAENIHFTKGKIRALTRLGEVLRSQGEYPGALEAHLMALQLGQQTRDLGEQAATLSFAGLVYTSLAEYRQGLNYLLEARTIYDQKNQRLPGNRLSKREIAYMGYLLSNIGDAYGHLGRLDSAIYFQKQALTLQLRSNMYSHPLKALILTRLGEIQQHLGDDKGALTYYQQALSTAIAAGDLLNMANARTQIAKVYQLHYPDSSLHYARLAFNGAQKISEKTTLLSISILLAQLYIDRIITYWNFVKAKSCVKH